MTDPGYYDQSIPPALLMGGARRRTAVRAAGASLQAAPAAASDQQPSPLLVTAGEPGQYQPAGKAADRPRNVTELNSAGAVADPSSPWTAGQYVPVGTSGKRAHWNGEEWRGGESPGYPATPVQNEQPAADMAAAPAARHAAPEEPAADTVDEDDMPKDAARMSPPPRPPAPYRAGTQFPGDEQPGDLSR